MSKKLFRVISIVSVFLSSAIFAKNSVPLVSPSFFTFSLKSDGLNPTVLKLAVTAYNNAVKQGIAVNKEIVTVIDYSLPSNEKRLWVLDLENEKVLFHTFVAHGKYSGENTPDSFSDRPGSLQSSIGVFLTKGTYFGHEGYSLVLQGLEKGYNLHAESRRIVVHGAPYVSKELVDEYGRIGRSWGCPAVERELAVPIINTIKEGSLVVAYYPDKKWLHESRYLNYA